MISYKKEITIKKEMLEKLLFDSNGFLHKRIIQRDGKFRTEYKDDDQKWKLLKNDRLKPGVYGRKFDAVNRCLIEIKDDGHKITVILGVK